MADWKADVGFTRLQTIATSDLPSSLNKGFSQTEANTIENTSSYSPDTNNSLFTGKNFTLKSGASTVSGHATSVASSFYSTSSLLPSTAACPVDLYEANNWIQNGFLNTGITSPPQTENRAIQNHSWISTTGTGDPSTDAETNQRLDFAINRDGFVGVVGENNGGSSALPVLLGQSYHSIAVGRSDGMHSHGTTSSFDGSGRIKPDIVAPATTTSGATPMVGSAAGVLYQRLTHPPFSLATNDFPRVIKALLLTTARKDTVPAWDNTNTRPLDETFGAGELNIYHAYTALLAGRVTAGNASHGIRNWAAENVAANASKTYFFTIPSGTPHAPFCTALTWHRVITDNLIGPFWGNLSTAMADINLKLHSANGTSLGSEITNSSSSVDNVEMIYQAALPSGDYAIVVENTSLTDTDYALAWHSLPAVTVTASTPTANESNSQPGIFTITRTGDTTLPLYVPLLITGDAIPGTHYQTLSNHLTIAAGQSSATIYLTPISDNTAQGDRLVTVDIADDFSLIHGQIAPATVTIKDKPFDHWRFVEFSPSELNDPSISSANANPDFDSFVNLIEYALGLNPKLASLNPITASENNGYLSISTPKNPEALDLTWSAEVTSNLSDWSPAVILTDTLSSFSARDDNLMSQQPRRFIRLKIKNP